MVSFKELCISLRKKNYTLPEIVRLTGRSKTSVYYHIRSTPLSDKKWQQVLATSGARIRIFARARKGQSTRAFGKIQTWDQDTVFLVAHYIFDGSLGNGGCSYNNRSETLIRRVEKAMKHIYDFATRRYHNDLTGVLRISYFNVALLAHIQEVATGLLGNIQSLSKENKRVFLQAFFDDEGCMDFRPWRNTRRIRGYQKDVAVLDIVQELLLEFGIQSFIQQPNEVVVTGKENLRKFQSEIKKSAPPYPVGPEYRTPRGIRGAAPGLFCWKKRAPPRAQSSLRPFIPVGRSTDATGYSGRTPINLRYPLFRTCPCFRRNSYRSPKRSKC